MVAVVVGGRCRLPRRRYRAVPDMWAGYRV